SLDRWTAPDRVSTAHVGRENQQSVARRDRCMGIGQKAFSVEIGDIPGLEPVFPEAFPSEVWQLPGEGDEDLSERCLVVAGGQRQRYLGTAGPLPGYAEELYRDLHQENAFKVRIPRHSRPAKGSA